MDASDTPREQARPPSVLDDLYETRETPRQPLRLGWRTRRAVAQEGDAVPEDEAPQRNPEQRSLFLEILDWMLVPLLLLWPLSVGITFVIARSLADAPFDRALLDRVEVVAQQVRSGSNGLLLPQLTGPDEGLDDDDGGGGQRLHVQVIDNDGTLLAGDPDLPRPGLYDFPETGAAKLRNEEYGGQELRIGYVHVETVREGEEGQVLIQIGESLDRRNRLANEIIKGVIFPQFVVLPLALVLVWFGLSRGLAPLKSLQQRIHDRHPDDTSPIDPRGAPEEVGPLIDAFNDLLARQMQSVRAQKRFIADAAHQIRTPLAGLQMQAELALREHDPVEVRRSLQQLVRSSERAARMATQLLAMARAEHMRDAMAFTRLDLAALVRETVADWVPTALARGIDLGLDDGSETPRDEDDFDDALAPLSPWPTSESMAARNTSAVEGTPGGPDTEGVDDAPDGPAATVVDGHPVLLRELLANLVDNALRYTPRGGSVTVRLEAADTGHGPRLSVVDTGPGIPETERELVFERFYRVLGTQVDGSGLGLAIVREIALQHGAEVSVGPNPVLPDARGAAFTVTFPSNDHRHGWHEGD